MDIHCRKCPVYDPILCKYLKKPVDGKAEMCYAGYIFRIEKGVKICAAFYLAGEIEKVKIIEQRIEELEFVCNQRFPNRSDDLLSYEEYKI